MKRDLVATSLLVGVGMLTVAPSAIVVPSLLSLAEYLAGTGDGPSAANLFLVVPSVGIVVAAPVVGWLADRFGRWHTLLGSVALLVLSGVSGYWTTQYPLLLIERFVLGCSIAGTATCSASLLGSRPEEAQRQSLLGRQSAFANVAGLAYLFLGGQLAAMHWRLPFLIYLWPVVLVPFLVFSLQAEPRARASTVVAAPGGFAAWLRGPALPVLLLAWVLGCLTMLFIFSLFTVHPYRMQELGLEDPRIVSLTVMTAAVSSAITSWNLRRIGRHLGPYAVFALTFLLFGMGFFECGDGQGTLACGAGQFRSGNGHGPPCSQWSRLAERDNARRMAEPRPGCVQYVRVCGPVPFPVAASRVGILLAPHPSHQLGPGSHVPGYRLPDGRYRSLGSSPFGKD